MIRTSTTQGSWGVERSVQLVCDECSFTTEYVHIGGAASDRSTGLASLRAGTGFVEVGRQSWASVAAPAGVGETTIEDCCARCADKKRKMS